MSGPPHQSLRTSTLARWPGGTWGCKMALCCCSDGALKLQLNIPTHTYAPPFAWRQPASAQPGWSARYSVPRPDRTWGGCRCFRGPWDMRYSGTSPPLGQRARDGFAYRAVAVGGLLSQLGLLSGHRRLAGTQLGDGGRPSWGQAIMGTGHHRDRPSWGQAIMGTGHHGDRPSWVVHDS